MRLYRTKSNAMGLTCPRPARRIGGFLLSTAGVLVLLGALEVSTACDAGAATNGSPSATNGSPSAARQPGAQPTAPTELRSDLNGPNGDSGERQSRQHAPSRHLPTRVAKHLGSRLVGPLGSIASRVSLPAGSPGRIVSMPPRPAPAAVHVSWPVGRSASESVVLLRRLII